MPTIKPQFPTITTAQLGKAIDHIEKELKNASASGASAGVDLAKLADQAAENGDHALRETLHVIRDSFQRMEPYTSSCSGSVTTGMRPVPAKLITADELTTVLGALAMAKQRVEQHLGGDHQLSPEEAKKARELNDSLAAKVARSVIEAALDPYEHAVLKWRTVLSETAYAIEAREQIDKEISSTARWHARSNDGAEALTWAMRAAAVNPATKFDLVKAEEELRGAETSWLTVLPFVGARARRSEGHLDDEEIAKHLGTDDLAAFITQKKAAVAGSVGSYKDYLEGKDLPGHSQLADPDFVGHTVRSTC